MTDRLSIVDKQFLEMLEKWKKLSFEIYNRVQYPNLSEAKIKLYKKLIADLEFYINVTYSGLKVLPTPGPMKCRVSFKAGLLCGEIFEYTNNSLKVLKGLKNDK